jgi:hypothetical protein
VKRLKIAQMKVAKMIRSTEFVARHNKTYTLSLFYTHKVTSPHRLETAIRNCVGKIQPYALTDDGPTAEQPQGAPIGRLAFPGLAKRARRGATRGAAKDKSLPRVRRVTICAGLQLHRSEKAPLLRKAQKWATPENFLRLRPKRALQERRRVSVQVNAKLYTGKQFPGTWFVR